MLKVRASELVNGISNNQDPNTNSIADITITIRDVNDEPPVFNQPEYKVSLHENVPFGNFSFLFSSNSLHFYCFIYNIYLEKYC